MHLCTHRGFPEGEFVSHFTAFTIERNLVALKENKQEGEERCIFTEDANTEVTANDKLELFLKWIQACRNSEHNSKGTLANLTIVAFVFKKSR